MEPKICWQPVQPHQVEALCRLAAGIWREHYGQLLGERQISYMLEKFQSPQAVKEQLAAGNYRYYFVQAEETAAGYVGIRLEPEQNSLFLSKLYLKKEYRGQKLASKTLGFLEQLCREQGLTRIWLTVNRENTGSIAAYKAMGFTVFQEDCTDIGEGFVMDDFWMEKRL